MQWLFFDLIISSSTLSCEFRVHRAGSQLKMSERQKLGTCKTCKLAHLQTCTLSFTHSGHAEQLLFSCLCSKVTITFSHCHSLTLTVSHSHTLSISHSLSLDMLNNFCFYLYGCSHTVSISLSFTVDMLNIFCD